MLPVALLLLMEALLAGWSFIHQDRHLHHSMLFVAARMLGGFVCMCLFYPAIKLTNPGIRFRTPTVSELKEIVVLATIGITMSETLYQWGLAATSPAFAATYVATLPIFTIILACACGQEKLSVVVAFNITCASLGTVFLAQRTPQFSKAATSQDKHAIPPKHYGHLMLIASYFLKAGFLVLLRRFHRRHSEYESFVGVKSTRSEGCMGSYCLTFWAYCVAMVQVVLVLAANGQLSETIDVGLNGGRTLELLYGMICVSALCPCILTWANMYMGRSTSVAIFACAHPLFVMGMSWLFEGFYPGIVSTMYSTSIVMVLPRYSEYDL
jgi:drug/metabolite transporter (DMT)-like permease